VLLALQVDTGRCPLRRERNGRRAVARQHFARSRTLLMVL
jgi:hypothetical protein